MQGFYIFVHSVEDSFPCAKLQYVKALLPRLAAKVPKQVPCKACRHNTFCCSYILCPAHLNSLSFTLLF